ncbi:MAG TPA: class I SAM-dependent methyltransferase [Candidatus Binatia bacterium]|nr:class I SAM-dependent methyltransferase [Candidatus Binatia bacterium]
MNAGAAEKYNDLAEGFAERTWANLAFDMHRRLILATTWGKALHVGDSIVEFGCGDGYLAQLFVQEGFHYRGLDISPSMVAVAERRLSGAELTASFLAVDVDQVSLIQPIDAAISYMGAFFTFVNDPQMLLQRVRPYIRKKIIVDLNPRGRITIPNAMDMLKTAGFQNIAWRPFFVPVTMKLPAAALRTLSVCESVPVLRSLPLRWKFNVLLKGEVDSRRRDRPRVR